MVRISEKKIDTDYILEVKPIKIVEELNVECERVKYNPKVLTLANENTISNYWEENYKSSSLWYYISIQLDTI